MNEKLESNVKKTKDQIRRIDVLTDREIIVG